MLLKEYRICMPLKVEEYKIGQLYMIAKHSLEQSEKGQGVEVIKNETCTHPKYGNGQFTEKRIHLSSRLPNWIQAMIPKIFYITEKASNFYPYTITEYSCSFFPKFSIVIDSGYVNDNGVTENCLTLSDDDLSKREIVNIDIINDEYPEKYYKIEEDPKLFQSHKTGRGKITDPDWKNKEKPIMCSYKSVKVFFEVWGLQTNVERYVHSCVQEILLVGHRQAFAWIDEWIDMSMDELRKFEKHLHEITNKQVLYDDNNQNQILAENVA